MINKLLLRSGLSVISLLLVVLGILFYYSNLTDIIVVQVILAVAVILALVSGYLRIKN